MGGLRLRVALASLGILGVVVGVFWLGRSSAGPGDAAPVVTETRTVVVTGGAAVASAPAGSASRVPVLDAVQVELKAGQGVDLDSGATAVDARGPNGDIDLHYSDSGLSANGGFFPYYGPEGDARSGCTTAVRKAEPQGTLVPSKQGQLCFRTSKGAVGWSRVNDFVIIEAPTGNYAVLNTRVWP